MDTTLILLLIPVMIIQLALIIIALVNISKKAKVKYMNKVAWIIIIIMVNLIGPICYLILEGEKNDSD